VSCLYGEASGSEMALSGEIRRDQRRLIIERGRVTRYAISRSFSLRDRRCEMANERHLPVAFRWMIDESS